MLKDLGSMMRQVQEMGEKVKASQKALAEKTLEVSAGAGLVRMTFNGRTEALSITISPEMATPENLKALEDLVLSAVNMGISRAREEMQEAMREAAGGLPIPDLGL